MEMHLKFKNILEMFPLYMFLMLLNMSVRIHVFLSRVLQISFPNR